MGSGSGKLLIWGDAIHVPAILFERPELTWELDADRGTAQASRLRLLERAVQEDCWVAGAHVD